MQRGAEHVSSAPPCSLAPMTRSGLDGYPAVANDVVDVTPATSWSWSGAKRCGLRRGRRCGWTRRCNRLLDYRIRRWCRCLGNFLRGGSGSRALPARRPLGRLRDRPTLRRGSRRRRRGLFTLLEGRHHLRPRGRRCQLECRGGSHELEVAREGFVHGSGRAAARSEHDSNSGSSQETHGSPPCHASFYTRIRHGVLNQAQKITIRQRPRGCCRARQRGQGRRPSLHPSSAIRGARCGRSGRWWARR